MTRAAIVCAVIAAAGWATPARADVWSDASAGQAGADMQTTYEVQMEHGDDAAQLAATASSRSNIERFVDQAVLAYTVAAKAQPARGEPYARIGKLLFSIYFEECGPLSPKLLMAGFTSSPLCIPFEHARARQLDEAWAAFAERSPFDPRIRGLRFERAIVNTKLATRQGLVEAAAEYRAILDEPASGDDLSTVENNLAETYMMLGQLEDSIDMYRIALAAGADRSSSYGLAVALDRDGQGIEAARIVADLGEEGLLELMQAVARGATFFVPPGEQFYYLALAHEALDYPDVARLEWREYIASGAHPQYQPRAREHLAKLEVLLRRPHVPKSWPPSSPPGR